MRVLMLSKEGEIASLAYKLTKEGHNVDLWIDNRSYSLLLKGFVNRPVSWRPVLQDADLVICDSNKFSEYEQLFRRMGKPVLGCNPIGDVLESNKEKSIEALEKLGINPIPSSTFDNITDAIGLVWANDSGYLVEVAGGCYKCETKELYTWLLSKHSNAKNIVVTEVYPDDLSIRVTTEGWFSGIDWIQPFSHTFKCADGTITLPLEKADKLVQATVARFKPLLVKTGYRGPISIDCIVTQDIVYAKDIHVNFLYDSFPSFMTGLNEPVGSFLFDLATGIKRKIDIRNDFLISVCVEYGGDLSNASGMPIGGLTDTDMKFTYPESAYKGDDVDEFLFAATDDDVLTATAFGRSITEAQHRVYKICKNIKGIDIEYNLNVGDSVSKDIAHLRDWGWL